MKIFSAMCQKGRWNGKTISVEFAFLMKPSTVSDSRILIAKIALAHRIPFLFKYSKCQILSYNEDPVLMA